MIQSKPLKNGGFGVSVIGAITNDESFFFYSDAQEFTSALNEADGAPITLFIASPGGSLDAALAMRAALEGYNGAVEIHTAGIVASAATLLLCVKNAKVVAHSGSIFMIHKAAAQSYGNADDARKTAQMLDVCDSEIVKVYQTRVAKDEKEILKLLKSETWMTSAEAKELGLVDELSDEPGVELPALNAPATVSADAIANACGAQLRAEFAGIRNACDAMNDGIAKRFSAMQAERAAENAEVHAKIDSLAEAIEATRSERDADRAEIQALRAQLDEANNARALEAENNKIQLACMASKLEILDKYISRSGLLNFGESGFTVHDENAQSRTKKFVPKW